mgnify:CR=1
MFIYSKKRIKEEVRKIEEKSENGEKRGNGDRVGCQRSTDVDPAC